MFSSQSPVVLSALINISLRLCALLLCVWQDVCQSLEKQRGALLSLSTSARRLSERERAEQLMQELQRSHERSLKQAVDMQNRLENVLGLWQK